MNMNLILLAALVIIAEMVNLFKLAGEHDAEEKRKATSSVLESMSTIGG